MLHQPRKKQCQSQVHWNNGNSRSHIRRSFAEDKMQTEIQSCQTTAIAPGISAPYRTLPVPVCTYAVSPRAHVRDYCDRRRCKCSDDFVASSEASNEGKGAKVPVAGWLSSHGVHYDGRVEHGCSQR